MSNTPPLRPRFHQSTGILAVYSGGRGVAWHGRPWVSARGTDGLKRRRISRYVSGSPIQRAKYAGFLRNIALQKLAALPNDLVAEHARWALERLCPTADLTITAPFRHAACDAASTAILPHRSPSTPRFQAPDTARTKTDLKGVGLTLD